MQRYGESLLHSLKRTRWDVAANTYGNNHATLIGLLVEWWISSEPQTHRAIESGPSYGKFPKGKGGGMCDAVFCENSNAVGVLEVEGTRGKLTIEKIGKFFHSGRKDLKTLRFAVVVLYPTGPRGRGPEKKMPSCWDAEIASWVTEVSQTQPDRPIIVVTLDKLCEPQVEGIRCRTVCYHSKLMSVQGFAYEGGEEVACNTLWEFRGRNTQ
jgi:hypothetical protein